MRHRRRFYPLLVVAEGFPVSPFKLPTVRERAHAKGLLTGNDVAQLEIVYIVELEMLEALAENGGPNIAQILAAKRKADLSNSSMRDFIVLEMNRQPGRPTRLDGLWTAIFDVIADTLGVARRRLGSD